MAAAAIPLVGEGLSLVSGLRRKRPPSIGKIIEKYFAMRPGGYTTPEDVKAANATQSRLTGQAEASGKGARIRLNRSLVARGIAGPAALAAGQGINEQVAAGRESAAQQGAAQLYDRYSKNASYMQDLVGQAFGAEVGAAQQDRARYEGQKATLWNSVLQTAPYLTSVFTKLAATAPGVQSVTGYDDYARRSGIVGGGTGGPSLGPRL